MRIRYSRLAAVLTGAILIFGLSACGSDSDITDESNSANSSASEDSTTTEGDGEAEVSQSNPLVLGFEISGPAGTVVEVSTVAVAGGTEQPKLDQTFQLTGEPKWQLFSTFIEEAVMTLKVTEGGPAKIVGFRANYKDSNDPTKGYVIDEELKTMDLDSGKVSVVMLP